MAFCKAVVNLPVPPSPGEIKAPWLVPRVVHLAFNGSFYYERYYFTYPGALERLAYISCLVLVLQASRRLAESAGPGDVRRGTPRRIQVFKTQVGMRASCSRNAHRWTAEWTSGMEPTIFRLVATTLSPVTFLFHFCVHNHIGVGPLSVRGNAFERFCTRA